MSVPMELPRAEGVAAGGVEAAAGPAAPAVARFEVDPAAAAVADAPEEYALAAPLRDLVRKSVGRFLPDAAKGGKRAMRDAETWFAALDTINKQAKLLKVDDEYGGGRCLRCGPGQTRRDAKDAERGTDRPPFETMILMVRERRGGGDAEEKHVRRRVLRRTRHIPRGVRLRSTAGRILRRQVPVGEQVPPRAGAALREQGHCHGHDRRRPGAPRSRRRSRTSASI